MTQKTNLTYSSLPGSVRQTHARDHLNRPPQKKKKPPRQTDWLMILVVSLFLLTLLIAWLSKVPLL